MRKTFYRLIAKEFATLAPYFDRVLQPSPLSHEDGLLARSIEEACGDRVKVLNEPVGVKGGETTELVLLNGNMNYTFDIEGELRNIRSRLSRSSRVGIVQYSPYYAWLYRLASALGIRKAPQPLTFVTTTDLLNLCKLANVEIVRERGIAYFPLPIPLISHLWNWIAPAIPGIRRTSFVNVYVLRPIHFSQQEKPMLTVVIPARNEKGNIEAALQRMPNLGCSLEVIFVEGHSNDGTWEEIQRVLPLYRERFAKLKAFRQTGKGKNDAVQVGFAEAEGEVLTILDADLTMPPEMLGRFYEAYTSGKADFVNGSRLVYPMEGEAMRFLNHLGNVFFAKALSFVLGTRLGDSLCGTKLMSRRDYLRIRKWNTDFGKFDPFGDFELLFPAGVLGLGTINVPIRYLARTYGTTNISRFRHGFMLLRMTWIGLVRLKLGRV